MMTEKRQIVETAKPFIGCWRLVSAKFQVLEGKELFPLGNAPEGLLIYDACGNFTAQLMQPGRKPLASGDQLSGTCEEIREAFEGYVAYFGYFTLDSEAGTVTHHVQGSLFPNWIGSSQLRFYELEGDTLILHTPPLQSGGCQIEGKLVWQKEKVSLGSSSECSS